MPLIEQSKKNQDSELERLFLEKKLLSLEKEHSELKKKYFELRKAFGNIVRPEELELPEMEKKCKFYKLLLEKFSEAVNNAGKKTVGEIKSLVNTEDLTIQSIISEIKPKDFVFEQDFLKTAEKAFNYLIEEIDFVEPGISINFWLEPKEMLESGIADDEDLAVFLCTLLHALGNEESEVVIAELDNLSTHAFVTFEFNQKFFILDPSQKHSFNAFSGSREEALSKYSFKNARIKRFLYKFNDKDYEQFF